MPNENILILAVKTNDQFEDRFQSSLDEIISLCYTAGGEVVEVITQNREKIHGAHYLGTGKIEEARQLIEDHEIDLIICNDELSSSQLRNLSHLLNVRLIDRSQLILDIFAQRAKTKEGQLQVELAQLEYLLPRLRGQGTELSRLGGGIGTRGPGETKLETDQRYIRQRIDDIKRRLKIVVKQREQYRNRRKLNKTFQIAIVGYTNAGKSTIFNHITKSETLAENKLFATLDPLTRKLKLPSGFEVLITDTVGFIQDLPTSLIAAFRSTLEEVSEADFIWHVVDGSNPDIDQQQETVVRILKELEADHIPMLTVYNKKDLIIDEFIPTLYPNILIHAHDKEDINKLLMETENILRKEWESYALAIDPSEGTTIYRLEQQTIVIDKHYDAPSNQYVVQGYIQKDHPLHRLIKENQ